MPIACGKAIKSKTRRVRLVVLHAETNNYALVSSMALEHAKWVAKRDCLVTAQKCVKRLFRRLANNDLVGILPPVEVRSMSFIGFEVCYFLHTHETDRAVLKRLCQHGHLRDLIDGPPQLGRLYEELHSWALNSTNQLHAAE